MQFLKQIQCQSADGVVRVAPVQVGTICVVEDGPGSPIDGGKVGHHTGASIGLPRDERIVLANGVDDLLRVDDEADERAAIGDCRRRPVRPLSRTY